MGKIFKKRTTLQSLSKRVHKMEKEVELKQNQAYYYSNGGTALTTLLTSSNPITSIALNCMFRGNGPQSRLADDIRATSIHLTGTVYPVTGGTYLGFYNKVRIVVFWDVMPEGAAPRLCGTAGGSGTKEPLFLTTASTVVYPFTQYNTLDGAYYQYKVISDTIHTLETKIGALNSSNVPQSVNCEFLFDLKIKLNRECSMSRGNAGNIGDCQKNALYVAFITDSSDALEVDMDSVFYYKDA